MIYVSEQPWTDKAGAAWFIMWADTPDEAFGAIYAAGGDETQRAERMNTLAAYDVTPDQFATLCTMGITVTDRMGLPEWCARRDGRKSMVDRIVASRAAGCI